MSGSDLFVTDYSTGTIGQYDATTGAAVHVSLVSGLDLPGTIAISGSNLFVYDRTNGGRIGEYTTSGATVNADLISGLNSGPDGVAVSGSDLYVTNFNAGTIGKYTLGATPGTITSSIPAYGFGSGRAGRYRRH